MSACLPVFLTALVCLRRPFGRPPQVADFNFKQTAWLLGLQLSVFVSTMECNQALRIADWML